jgi:sugar phosphate isomerase/epimerase
MIKIASMVGGPDLRKGALAPYSGDLRAAFGKLARLGYDGVELMIKNPRDLEGSRIRGWLEEHGLRFVGICTGHVFFEDGLGLIESGPRISQAALKRFRELIDLAAAISPRDALVTIGRSRGMGEPQKPEATWRLAVDAFRELAAYAQPRGIRLVLEPLSPKEATIVLSTDEGVRMVESVNCPNFGLMLDVYHMNLTERNVADAFRRAGSRCWHVHVCDQDRRSPASGTIDYRAAIGALKDTGYSGFLSTEIQPWPDPDTAARASIEFLRSQLPASEGVGAPAKGRGHGR